ncbi:hypothetical protein FRC01_002271 [Tulasnella sp. 417]|nr:hypothetical protein FRC01_002271 [Tulasnella sp. 417]
MERPPTNADNEVLPEVPDCDPDEDTTGRHSFTFNIPGDEDDKGTPLSPALVEAAYANLRNSNDSDASLVRPSTITAPPPRTGPGPPRRPTQHERGPSLPPARSSPPPHQEQEREEEPQEAVRRTSKVGGLPRGNITAPASSRWASLFRLFKNRLNKIWGSANEFMTVPMWAALLGLIVACVQPFQHALQNHMQPVKRVLVAAGNCTISVTLVVLRAYFYSPLPESSPTEDVPLGPAPTVAATRAEEDDRDACRRSGSPWSLSELSIATLTDNIGEAIKLRVGGYKKLGSPMTSKRELREQLAEGGRQDGVCGDRVDDVVGSRVGVACRCGVGVLGFAEGY